MNTTIVVLIGLLIALCAGYGLASLRHVIEQQREEIQQLKEAVKQRPQNLPYLAGQDVLNAEAILIDKIIRHKADLERDYQLLRTLQRVAGGEFDPEQPAGRRPAGMDD